MTGTAQELPRLPPMATVAHVLRATTEHLAGELANPRATPPAWTEFEWRTARAAAVMHGISGLLAENLLWRGPEGWAEFLSRQREHITHRQLRIHELLATVGERFQHQGIPVQVLKGAALHLEGLYRHGERPMADLDLLTPPQHTVRACEILQALGLRESHRTFKHRVFEARDPTRPRSFGEHGDNDMKVELHERICEPLPYRLTDISQRVSPPVVVPGLNPYPSRAALMAHLLLHAAGGMAYRTLRLIQLHDIALLARHLTAGDWQRLLDWRPWWAWPPLVLTGRYYGAAVPDDVAAAVRAFCPSILRRTCARQLLSDVSLSRLWLEAFPGIEWAQTIGEAVAFIARRIVPSAEVRSDRKFALTTDPSLARGDWGGLSQSRRILRALRARTPRPWPLHNVRAALAEPH
jgi:Uncharacterised nucleotidyltransferase